MVGIPGDPCTGCNRSWYPKRKLDNAQFTYLRWVSLLCQGL
jgi:hypothetical protein